MGYVRHPWLHYVHRSARLSFPRETDVTASQELHYDEISLLSTRVDTCSESRFNNSTLVYSPGVGGCLG
jgi:hypothetical protein